MSADRDTAAEMLARVYCMAAGELGDCSERDKAALKFVLETRKELLAAVKTFRNRASNTKLGSPQRKIDDGDLSYLNMVALKAEGRQ